MRLTIPEQIAALDAERVQLQTKGGAVGALSPLEQERLRALPGLIAGLFAQKRAGLAAGSAERSDYRRAGR
jgi:hypothetical protein